MTTAPTRPPDASPDRPRQTTRDRPRDRPPRPRGGSPDARYLRHQAIDWFDQAYVRSLDVIVVGAGATGNEVAKNLCLLGVGALHVVDFDRVEPHNLPRAVLLRDEDVGRTKAEAVAERCAALDPNVAVSHAEGDLRDVLQPSRLRRAGAVVACVDNLEARLALNAMCLLAGVPLVNTAIDSRSVVVEHYPFGPASACACYACTLPASAWARMRDRYSCGWLRKAAAATALVPTTIVTSSIAGAIAANEILLRLRESPAEARRTFVDTRTMAVTQSVLVRDEACVACAGRPRYVAIVRAARDANVVTGAAAAPDGVAALLDGLVVRFSEPIVTDVACNACGAALRIDEPARLHDDSLAYCPACRMNSRRVDIVEQLPLDAFVARYAGSRVPGAFLQFDLGNGALLMELE